MHDALFGMETEMAFSAWRGQEPVDASDREHLLVRYFGLAHERLRSLRDEHSIGLFLENGARIYPDAGLHPEYCTPECRSPEEVVRWQLAGERVMTELGDELVKHHPDTRLAIYRCNVDYSGSAHTWGCHESYQHRCSSGKLKIHLIPHLVSRIVYTGAGGLNNRCDQVEFLLSPRVPHLENESGSESTDSRSLYHTKNEPLGGGGFSRLHLICGESNSSQLATYLKFGTTALIVRLIDAGALDARALRFESARQAMFDYARDPACRTRAELRDGRHLTAVEIQREYLRQVESQLGAEFMPDWAPLLCERWRGVLDDLEHDPRSLSTRLDWSIKYELFSDRVSRAGKAWGDLRIGKGLAAELCEIDTRFGELGPQGIFHSLDRAELLEHRLPELGSVEEAMTTPPAGGRAEVRGRAIRELHCDRDRYQCGWGRIGDGVEGRTYDMSDTHGGSPQWRSHESFSTRRPSVDTEAFQLQRELHRGIDLYHEMQLSEACEVLQITANAARMSDELETEATARFWCATAHMDRGHLSAAEGVLNPILATVDRDVSDEVALRVWTRYALVLIDRPAERTRIEEAIARSRACYARIDGSTGRSRLSMLDGRFQGALGNYDAAIEAMVRGLAEEREDVISFARSSYQRWLVTYLVRADLLYRASRSLERWRREAGDSTPPLYDHVALMCAESLLARCCGDYTAAFEHARSATERSSEQGRNRYSAIAHCALISSAVEVGELDAARLSACEINASQAIEAGEVRCNMQVALKRFYRARVEQPGLFDDGDGAEAPIVGLPMEAREEIAEQAARAEVAIMDERLGVDRGVGGVGEVGRGVV